MATATETIRYPANIDIQGDLTVRGTIPTVPRSSIVQESIAPYLLPPQLWRVWDAFQTAIATAGSDDLGVTAGAFATGCPYITAGDNKALGATTRRARIIFTLPPEYVAGETVQLRAAAGMLTTVADTSCTVDFECYKLNRDTLKTGSDLVTTSATTMNSLTFGEKVFAVTATSLSPGDILDIRLSITCTDAATGTAVTPALAAVEVQLDVKG